MSITHYKIIEKVTESEVLKRLNYPFEVSKRRRHVKGTHKKELIDSLSRCFPLTALITKLDIIIIAMDSTNYILVTKFSFSFSKDRIAVNFVV